MKRVFLLLCLFTAISFPEAIVKKGYGKAPVGANQTEVEVEEIAHLRAQSDALSKIGTYVESSLHISKSEVAGRASESTTQSLRSLAVGLIQLVEGTKRVRKTLDPKTQVTLIEVKADFQIDAVDFKNVVEALSSRKSGSDDLRKQIEQFSLAETRLVEINHTEVLEPPRARRLLKDYKSGQKNVANGVLLVNGSGILQEATRAIDLRKAGIQSYLDNIAAMGGPSAIYKTSLLGKPMTEDLDGERFRVSMEVNVEENAGAASILKKNHAQAERFLYPNGKPDYLTQKLRPSILWFPLALCFVNRDKKVIAYSLIQNHKAPGLDDKWYYVESYIKMVNPEKSVGDVFDKDIGFGTPDPDTYKRLFMNLRKVTFQAKIPRGVLERTASLQAVFLPFVEIRGYERDSKLTHFYESSNYDRGAFNTVTYVGGEASLEKIQMSGSLFKSAVSRVALALEEKSVSR